MHSCSHPIQRPSAATWLIITLAAGVYLAGGWSVSLWDRDEAWYAQTSRQMVQSGDWLIPRFLDQPRYAKPIFIYWCQAASMTVLGQTEMAARLPSALAMAGTLIILALTLARFANPRLAHYTILVFASSAMTIASAKMCLTDSVMLFFLTICQLTLAALYIHPSSFILHPFRHFLWPALALAILTKGPIPLVILLATSLMLALLDGPRRFFSNLKWLKQTRPLLGLAILLLICLPWPILAYIRNPDFLHNMFLEPMRHLSTNQDGHFIFPGYYVLTIWLTFFPFSLFLPFTLIHAWRTRTDPAVRFALATFIANLIFAELMITKLPHYLLPCFTALAYLTARRIDAWLWPTRSFPYVPLILATSIWSLPTLAIANLPSYTLNSIYNAIGMKAQLFLAIGVVYISVVLRYMAQRRLSAAIHALALGMFAAVTFLYVVYFPSADDLHLPVRIANELRRTRSIKPGELIMIGYAEPSLAFYTGGLIRPAKDDYLQTTPPEQWPSTIVILESQFQSVPADRKTRLWQIASLDGINYNTPFGMTTVLIYRKRPLYLDP